MFRINGNYNDEAEFDLGHVCSNVLRPGDVVANTVRWSIIIT